MKILIFEDDIYSFHQLRHTLEVMGTDYDVIGPITSVEQGRDYLSLHRDIDIIVAEVELPDGLVFEALSYTSNDVPIVFLSSTADYAYQAFSFRSLSYLLRPFDDISFSEAVLKACQLLNLRDTSTQEKGVHKASNARWRYRERFVVKSFNGERIVLLSTIQYIVSEHKSTYLVLLDGTSCPIDMSLDALSRQLDPNLFMRVNRKYIVPIEQVGGMERLVNGKELLKLKSAPSLEIIVSRTRKPQVRKWLDR